MRLNWIQTRHTAIALNYALHSVVIWNSLSKSNCGGKIVTGAKVNALCAYTMIQYD